MSEVVGDDRLQFSCEDGRLALASPDVAVLVLEHLEKIHGFSCVFDVSSDVVQLSFVGLSTHCGCAPLPGAGAADPGRTQLP